MKRIAIVGGTKYDTEMGCSLVSRRGVVCDGYPMADNAEKQNRLQYFSPSELQTRLEKLAKKIRVSKYDALLIFCNSLSVIVDHEALSKIIQIPVLSPIDVYKDIANKLDRFFLMAANGQCLSGIERIMIEAKGDVEIFGLSNLALVNSIEQGLPPDVIFRKFHVDLILSLAEKLFAQAVILGCTHLSHLYELIRESTSLHVIDVGREVVKAITKGTDDHKKKSYSFS